MPKKPLSRKPSKPLLKIADLMVTGKNAEKGTGSYLFTKSIPTPAMSMLKIVITIVLVKCIDGLLPTLSNFF
jgi:hypothetical protein